MDRRELPPILKNRVLELIQTAGLDFQEFDWDTTTGPWTKAFTVSRVTHGRTGFFVLFDVTSGGAYRPKGWPGRWPDRDSADVSPSDLLSLVQWWVQEITSEIKAPDLWRLAAEQASLGTDPNEANTPFTEEEQKQIGEELFRLEEFVYQAEPSLPVESRNAIAARFRFMKEAAVRLGRIDWASMVVGQLFSMATEKLITTQTFTALYNMAAAMFHQVVSIGGAIMTKLLG